MANISQLVLAVTMTLCCSCCWLGSSVDPFCARGTSNGICGPYEIPFTPNPAQVQSQVMESFASTLASYSYATGCYVVAGPDRPEVHLEHAFFYFSSDRALSEEKRKGCFENGVKLMEEGCTGRTGGIVVYGDECCFIYDFNQFCHN